MSAKCLLQRDQPQRRAQRTKRGLQPLAETCAKLHAAEQWL
eukprot:CAMPEP_0115139332 /NCGR_PEP_ID=MMETSP0227-20121206/58227_1 /TAXON_ID=89957 /ORGANISM="Polarella glacialis, Strain CCMP 1383" /LENGTH=40 /DNA_ID= /DNA_START= /DNA_END= /DNA_ORIENTATION=